MKQDRIEYIRQEEKNYHEYCYENYKLFESGSWLYKPVKTVLDGLAFVEEKDHAKILDLGCGVGRNSIPLAELVCEKGGSVVCVDFLEKALKKLTQYSCEFHVEEAIQIVQADIAEYLLQPNEYDYIVAVSSLEHVDTAEAFEMILQKMAAGTKTGGVNCIIVNSGVQEYDIVTGEELDALMEVNLPTDQMIDTLKNNYKGWKEINVAVKPLTYNITRGDKNVVLKTNAITFMVQNELE